MAEPFCSRLAARIRGGAAPIVIGLDPRIGALPVDLLPDAAPAQRIEAFYREILPVVAEHAPAVKPNIAFFEAHGAAGFAAYEATCRAGRGAGLLVIGDVKRGDIGSTAAAYARVHLDLADAVTLHPYLGRDSLEPFLGRCRDDGAGVFVLVRTSNPSAAEFQDLDVAGRPLCDAVAAAVDRWGADLGDPDGYSPIGAVVGATWPEELVRLRAAMPRAWLLLPGVGVQGGRVEDLAGAFDAEGLGALVNQSRGVMQCFAPEDGDWRARVADACAEFARAASAVATGGGPA